MRRRPEVPAPFFGVRHLIDTPTASERLDMTAFMLDDLDG